MSTPFLRRFAGAALCLLPLSQAVCAAATLPTTPAPPKALAAATAATAELQAAIEAGPDLARNLARLPDFRHTPATSAALRESFGSDKPWNLEQRGARSFRFSVLPLRHTLDNGGALAWSAFPIDMTVDKTGKRLNYRGSWLDASFEFGGTRMSLNDLVLDAKQRRGKGGLWFGDLRMDVARMAIQGSAAAPQQAEVRMNALRFTSRTLERARTVDLAQRVDLASFEVAGERIDKLVLAYRFKHLDKAALVRLAATARQQQASALGQQQALGELMKTMRQFVRAAASHKSGLVVERISASYGGHSFVIRGRLGVKQVQEADFATPKLLLGRIDGRFEVELPVALVRAVGATVARRQAAARGQAALSDQEIQSVARSITDVVVGKLLGGGYARLDDGMLRATIEIRNSVVRVNGKPVELPKPPQPGPGPVPAAPAAPGQASVTMPARRIDGSCTMPDYPEAVIARDAALALTLSVLVDATGNPAKVEVVGASDFPEYDRAFQAAIEGCRYVPALSGGTPVPQAVTVSLRREAGSLRP